MDSISKNIGDKIDRLTDKVMGWHNLDVKTWGKLPRRIFAIFTPLSHTILFIYMVSIGAMLLTLIASLFLLSTPFVWMEWIANQYRRYW